jgi:hypothetical protein
MYVIEVYQTPNLSGHPNTYTSFPPTIPQNSSLTRPQHNPRNSPPKAATIHARSPPQFSKTRCVQKPLTLQTKQKPSLRSFDAGNENQTPQETTASHKDPLLEAFRARQKHTYAKPLLYWYQGYNDTCITKAVEFDD